MFPFPPITRSVVTAALMTTSMMPALAQDAPSFQGSALLVLSDTTMPASAFVDGRLIRGDRDRLEEPDTLAVISLPLRPAGPPDQSVTIAEVEASNSVVGPPFQVTSSPDGRFAYVLETRQNAPAGTERVENVFAGLASDSHVTVVDITDKAAPKMLEKVIVAKHTHTIDMSPDGRLLAVNSYDPGRHIVLRHVNEDGSLGEEALAFGVEIDGKPLRRPGRIQWHPSGDFISLTLAFEDEVRFFRVNRKGASISLEPWGEPVKVGDFPDEGTFSPDGSFYVTTDLQWGDSFPPNYLDPPAGTLTAVRFDAENGRHQATGTATVSISPEGIAFSADGRHIVTASLTKSFYGWDDERLTMGGALDLVTLDPESGDLTHVETYPLQGILTEGLTFDASGEFVAVTHFDRYDSRRRRGVVEFWQLIKDETPRLARTNFELDVVPGPHTLHLMR